MFVFGVQCTLIFTRKLDRHNIVIIKQATCHNSLVLIDRRSIAGDGLISSQVDDGEAQPVFPWLLPGQTKTQQSIDVRHTNQLSYKTNIAFTLPSKS